MIQARIILGIVIGLVSYTSLYLGKGIQKYAVEGIKDAGTIKNRNSGIWIFGTVLTALPVFIQWAALVFAPVNLIAPLEGFGLVVLLAFSVKVLKERIRLSDLAGTFCIIAGIALIASFNRNSSLLAEELLRVEIFYLAIAVLLLPEAVMMLFFKKKVGTFAGIVFGFSAGTMMALQTLSKRLTLIEELRLPAIILTFIFAILTLALTQIGFAKSGAARVVPAFTTASVVCATLGAVLAFGEILRFIQILGLLLVLAGIVLITAFGSSIKAAEAGEKAIAED